MLPQSIYLMYPFGKMQVESLRQGDWAHLLTVTHTIFINAILAGARPWAS